MLLAKKETKARFFKILFYLIDLLEKLKISTKNIIFIQFTSLILFTNILKSGKLKKPPTKFFQILNFLILSNHEEKNPLHFEQNFFSSRRWALYLVSPPSVFDLDPN